LKKLWY